MRYLRTYTIRRRHRGFSLFIVIIAIAVVAIAMVVLAEGSKTMIFQTDGLYLQAAEENLTQSALAWAKLNASDPNISDQAMELDPNDLGIRQAGLRIEVSRQDGTAKTRITTTAARRNRTVSDTSQFDIEL